MKHPSYGHQVKSIVSYVVLLFWIHKMGWAASAFTADPLTSSSEDASATNNDEIAIIRQINKINEDGTYTYGYEAADGTFKIETRDVLGNIKGMFGFIDEAGDLKRVSYTANNETGVSDSTIHPPVRSTVRPSELSNRQPLLLLKTASSAVESSSSDTPVIQHIPLSSKRTHKSSTSSLNGTSSSTTQASNLTSTTAPTTTIPRRVLVSKRPFDEKDHPYKGGNNLRRQLNRPVSAADLKSEHSTNMHQELQSHHADQETDHRSSPIRRPPSRLNSIISESRPPATVRYSEPHSGSGTTATYQTVDPEAASDEITDISHLTTSSPSRVQIPLSQHYSRLRQSGLAPIAAQAPLVQYSPRNRVPAPNPNYLTQPPYNNQPLPIMVPPTIRDELMTVIYNYLQWRLVGPGVSYNSPNYYTPNAQQQNSYTPVGNAYPNVPPTQPNYPPSAPYINPYMIPQSSQLLYQSVDPTTDYESTTILQYPAVPEMDYNRLQNQEIPQRRQNHNARRLQTPRAIPAPATASQIDDADLLQMLLASPTRMPVVPRFSSFTTAPSSNINSKSAQPVRNVQIIGVADSETETPPRTR